MGRPLALIVDNDKRRKTILARALQSINMGSDSVSTLTEAKDLATRKRYQLIVLHMGAAKQKAYSFCEAISRGDPFLTLVAILPRINIKAESRLFDCGADEVVAAQQANPSVLLKRIIVHLRPCLEHLSEQHWVRLRTTWVSIIDQEVWCNGELRSLSRQQQALLAYILAYPGRTISRKNLFSSDIWGRKEPSTHRGKAVDMAVSNLRAVIEPDPKHPQIILSVHGEGFRLAPDLRARIRKSIAASFCRGL